MKLKVRFEKQDMQKFGLYALLLFIVVVLIMSNLRSISSGDGFAGLSFIALEPSALPGTLVVYLLTLVGLVVSCKSYFFEFDKGFGFTTEKKMDGYSKWADKKSMQAELKPVNAAEYNSKYAGIPLINDGKTLWVDDGEYHNLIIGSTGSGKTQCIIFPMVEVLAKHNESMVITDPKGEIYQSKAAMLKKRGYKIVVLNFRSPGQGNAWNPLNIPYKLWKEGNQDKSCELLDDLAANILYDEGNKNADPFWEKTSAGYFSGLALGLFEDATEEQVNINSISLMSTVGEERFGPSTYVKEYFNAKDPNSAAYVNASSTIMSPNETKGSILAVFKEKIKLFASRANLSEMLSHSDFSIADIGRQKTAVFIIIQDEKKTYHSLATIFVKQVYETLIDVAYQNNGKLPVRTNFLLDEFANMPPLKDVTTMITAARSRGMRFTLIIQNFAQLNEVYGEQNAETIKGNCGNMVYLISTELKALEEISKMCGEVKSKKDDKTSSTPLVTISDLQKMKKFEVIIRRLRMSPFKTYLTPEFKMNWGKKYPELPVFDIPERPRKEVSTFDVRDFVKAHREEKQNSLLGGMGGMGSLPFGGSPFGGSPFGGPSSSPFGGPSSSPFSGPSSSPFGSSSSSPFGRNPFDSPSNKDSKSSSSKPPVDDDILDSSFMDSLVKSIDEEIARLDAQEKEEKKALEEKTSDKVDVKDDEIILDDIINNKKTQQDNADALEKLFPDSDDDYTQPIPEKKETPDAVIVPKEENDKTDNFDEFWN